jgi:hypothetical protein
MQPQLRTESNSQRNASTSEAFAFKSAFGLELLAAHTSRVDTVQKKENLALHPFFFLRHITFLGSQPSPHQPLSIPGPTPRRYEFRVAAAGRKTFVYI